MQFICESHIAEVKCAAHSLFLQTLIIQTFQVETVNLLPIGGPPGPRWGKNSGGP